MQQTFTKAVNQETLIEVEAGSFNCIHKERYGKNSQNEQYDGLDHFYYAEGIGLIYDTTSYLSSETPIVIGKLDAYYVE